MLPRYRVYVWVVTLIAVNWISLVFVPPNPIIALGYLLGSFSACVTLAAGWSALGPMRLAWRFPLSIAWLLSLLIAVAFNDTLNETSSNGVFAVGVLLLVQWLLLQLPFLAMKVGLGLHLAFRDEVTESNTTSIRFGLRHLLMIMAIVGILLGIGRLMVTNIDLPTGDVVFEFTILGIAGVIRLFPLFVAVLLQRRVLAGTTLALIFNAAVTFAEFHVFQQISGTSRGTEVDIFIAINTSSAIVVLVIAGVVRLNGYSLQTKPLQTMD